MSQAVSDDGYDGIIHEVSDVLPGEEDRYEVFMPAVQHLVNALGGFEEVETADGGFETIYRPGDSVLAVLKDLKKLWRKDDTDDERTVARCMAKAGLMKELIGLVKECTPRGDWGRKVALMALDLVAALTWPIDVAAELKEMEDETEVPSDYASLLRYQVEYKALLLQNQTLRHLLTLLIPCFAAAGRDEKEDRVISLGLHVVRNLLAIKDVVAEDTATGDKEELSTLQSTLITQLDEFTYLELFLTLASESHKTEFNQYNMLLLEMIQFIFRSVKMHDLAMDQKRAPMENLKALLELEDRQKSRLANRKANVTRHSRFGTTIAVRAPTQKLVLHSQSAITSDPGKLLDEVKKTRKPTTKVVDDASANANLSPAAITVLQKFTREFLDCFNDFFRTALNDIQRERQKVRPADTTRALFVARFAMEYLLALRKKAFDGKNMADVDRDLPLMLVGEATEFGAIKWVVARIRMSMENKPVSWNELQAAIDCFTQILLILDNMMLSGDDEDKEVAGVLQNQIYYNGDVLDTSINVFTLWKPETKGQPVTFLDCTIHFAYVLLRMLEKYSKTKTYMFVRKKQRPVRRRQLKGDDTAPIPEEYENEEEVEPEPDAPSYKEHVFTFTAFEKRFAQEAVTQTLLVYLARYHMLDAEQIKRVVNLVHRQVVKSQAEGLYFTISSLHLFRLILDDKESLPKGDGTKNLLQLINYILRQFFKKVEKDPWVIVEAALPKRRGDWQHLSSLNDDEDDDEMGGQRSRIREKLSKSELEFIKKNNLSWSQQMGVAVSLLVSAGHEGWIKEIISTLEIALAARQEVVLRIDGDGAVQVDSDDEETVVRNFGGPSKDAVEKFERHDLSSLSDDLRAATTRDQHVKLMLKLLHFEKEDEDAEVLVWYLPSSVLPSFIETSIGALNQFLADPPTVEDPKKLLRRKRKARAHDSDSEDEDRPKIRRARKTANIQTFKSAAFIEDSDDDEAADAAFFAREEQLRAEMQALAEATGNTMRATGSKKRKRKHKDKDTAEAVPAGTQDMLSDDDVQMDSDDEEPVSVNGKAVSTTLDSDSDDDMPPTRRRKSMATADPDDSDALASGDEIAPATAHARPRTQRIIDSDDDE